MVGSRSAVDLVSQMKVSDPEVFHSMVKMHLSFLLDLHTDECDCSFLYEKHDKESLVKKAFTPMKKRNTKGVMDGVPLTQEGVCQVYQIIEYLGRNHNITCEGIFRKHGNLKKQQALKERLNKGVPLNLDDDEFSVHECAAVLKHFLAILPEPLLTDAYYRAHCQVPLLCRESMSEEDKRLGFEKKISSLQLLFQLIPEVNYTLLKDLLHFLHSVSQREESNKMSAMNLGTVFATHIICPRKLSPEALQSNHQLLARAVSFMIENVKSLFSLPDQLVLDIENHLNKKQVAFLTPISKGRKGNVAPTPKLDSPVVNTMFTFVDREASKSTTNATDQALAALYAHVQSLPESAQKRKLVTKLNQANGKGTPDVSTSGSVRTVGRRQQRRKSGDGLINLLTPRRKRPTHGSYSFRQPEILLDQQHSFRRQTSLQAPQPPEAAKVLSPSHSSPAFLSPRERVPSPEETPLSQASDVCAPVDEVDTPGQYSPHEDREDLPDSTGQHDGSFIVPPLPPRTPAPERTPALPARTPSGGDSPVSRAGSRMTERMLEAAMTPRSRAPVIICSTSQLEKWNKLVPSSPSLPEAYSEDEPYTDLSTDQESDQYFANLQMESEGEQDRAEEGLRPKDSCRTRSLSSEFKQYLARQGLEVPSDNSSLEDSMHADAEIDASYSSDVRRLLGKADKLSTSMQAVLDGGDPADLDDSAPSRRKSSRLFNQSFSSCSPQDCSSPLKACSSISRKSSWSTIKAMDSSAEDLCSDENMDPNARRGKRQRGRKRRSITEVSAANPLTGQNHGNIFFETDL